MLCPHLQTNKNIKKISEFGLCVPEHLPWQKNFTLRDLTKVEDPQNNIFHLRLFFLSVVGQHITRHNILVRFSKHVIPMETGIMYRREGPGFRDLRSWASQAGR
jgi:hypothetical protein